MADKSKNSILDLLDRLVIPVMLGILAATTSYAGHEISESNHELATKQFDFNKKLASSQELRQAAQELRQAAQLDTQLADWFGKNYFSDNPVQKKFALQLVDQLSSNKFKEALAKSVAEDAEDPKIRKAALKIAKDARLSDLRRFFDLENFKEADKETWKVLRRSIDQQTKILSIKDINNLSCQLLKDVDNLWLTNSNKKFGLSIQKQIWLSISSNLDYQSWIKFSDQIGWRVDNRWVRYNYISFTLDNIPKGNLPTRAVGVLWDAKDWGLERDKALVKRLQSCGI